MISEVSKVGKRGSVAIPAVLPLESYSSERKAEFLLSNATDAADFLRESDTR